MTSESADDLNRKYQQSYVMYRGQLTWIQKIYQENAGQVKVCGENREGQYIEEWLEPDMLQPFTLDQALVNVTSFRGIKYGASVPLILFRRSPRRQWRRGICSDNSTVTCPVRPMLRRFNIQVNVYESLSWKVIHHLLNPTYPTLERALAYCHKCMAVAISPMFFVCLKCQEMFYL